MNSDDSMVSAADISRNFGDWQSKALQHPVTITHHGRPRLMLVSVDTFKKEGAGLANSVSVESMVTRSQMLIDQFREGFYAVDRNFIVTEVNTAAAIYFNSTREMMIGHDIRERYPETLDSFAWNYFRRVLTTGEVVEFKVQGSLRGRPKMNIKAFPYDDGVGVLFSPAQVEEEASVLRKRGEALLGAMTQEPTLSLAVLNARGGLELVDDAFCRLSGFSRSQLKTLTIIDLAKDSERTALIQALNATVRDGSPQSVDVTFFTKEGDGCSVHLRMGLASHETAPLEIVVCAVNARPLGSSSGAG